MPRKPKVSKFQKFLIVGGALIVAQIIFLFAFNKGEPLTIRQAIDEQVKKQSGIPSERKEQLKIQLAIQDYMVKHNGKPPTTLQELIPEYFDSIPSNPNTGQMFAYKVKDGRPFVGDDSQTALASNKGPDGDKALSAEDEQTLLIASLDEKESATTYVYDPADKTDPFRPFNFAPPKEVTTGKSPLEQYDIGQLKLTAVLKGFDEPMAFVENAVGKGFPVKKGTKIGTNGGEIVEILPEKIMILETSTDFTGEQKSRTIEMKLRTKDQDPTKGQDQ